MSVGGDAGTVEGLVKWDELYRNLRAAGEHRYHELIVGKEEQVR